MKNISAKKIYTFFIFVCLFTTGDSFGSILLKGNPDAPDGKSFSFPLGVHASSNSGRSLYIGALNAGAQNFALSAISRNLDSFTPLAPEKVTINGVTDQSNPVNNTSISLLTLIDSGVGGAEHPIFVLGGEPASLYGLDNFSNPEKISLLRAQNVPDASGALTSGIVQIAAAPSSGVFSAGGTIFAAVKPTAAGTFGDVGSGVALALFGIAGNNESKKALVVIDAPTGGQNVVPPKAVALDKTSDVLKIQNNLAGMTDMVAMHYNSYNSQLYIGLQVSAGAAAGDGARAMAIGRVDGQNKLTLHEIAPTSVFNAQNQIVGALGANAQVSMHEIGSMQTSTYLSYLLIRGGNGDSATTRNKIFALPLVTGNTGDDVDKNGTIANKNQNPEDSFFGDSSKFAKRYMKEQATDASQMPIDTDPATLVGGGELINAGDITHMFVSGDAVFVTTSGDVKSGIFYSQALFESAGKIRAWTNWQRYAGVTHNAFGAFLDGQTSLVTYLAGADNNSIDMVKRTQWSMGQDGSLAQALNKEITQICGLFDLPVGTPALNNISLIVATGSDSLVMAQSGAGMGNIVAPTVDFSSRQSFENGTIDTALTDSKIIKISGGVLSEIGPLVAADIARNGDTGNQAWFFCAGCNGLAVLSNPDGSGIAGGQLGNNFSGLMPGMTFKKLGMYKFVRKLVRGGNYLFVLTDTQLDRIDLTAGNPTPENLATITTTIATNAQLSVGALLDVVISGQFALIGTTNGLFRVANNSNISNAGAPQVQWSRVPVPEGVGPVTQLWPISKTGRAQDVATMDGGQVYVLDADRGNNRSRINRFVIADVAAGGINDMSVVPFPDLFVKDISSYLVSLGEFRDVIATEGALNFHARAKELDENASVKFLPAKSRSGNQSILAPIDIAGSKALPFMVKDSASGSWLVGNDLGIHVNE